jgi:hypothetical protein
LFHCLIIAVSVQPWRISEKGIVLEAMKAFAKAPARVGESLSLWCDRTVKANPRYTILMYPNPDPAISRAVA